MQSIEVYGKIDDAILAAVEATLRKMLVSMPVVIDSSDQHTAMAHSAIKGLVRDEQGATTAVEMPQFQTAPVHFNGGGKTVRTHPVTKGDEGFLVFCGRAIDTWLQSGGIQPPIDARQHHPSDSIYIPGIKSDPNKIKHVSPDADHTRSLDGMVTHEVHPTTGVKSKVVSSMEDDPFNDGSIFHQLLTNTQVGVQALAKQADNQHILQLLNAIGLNISVQNGQHVLTVHPTNGINLTSMISVLINAATGVTSASISALASGDLSMSATNSIGLAAPLVNMVAGALGGGSLTGQSVPSSAMQPNSGAGFAPAGQVGESYGQDQDHLGVVTNTDKIVATVNVTPGLWMFWGSIWVEPDPSTVITGITGTISSTGLTSGRLSDAVQYWGSMAYGTGNFQKRSVGFDIVPYTTSKTITMVLSVAFTGGNCYGGGQLGCYRIQ